MSWSFLNGLLNHVVKELNVEEVLKSPIFVVQKAAAPKNGVEFRQGSNDTIRSSLAMSCDVPRRRARFSNSWSFLNGLLNHFVKELNVEEVLKSSILVVQKAAAVPLSWCFLNGLLNHVVKELNVEEVLKSSIFVVQKAAAPKNGVEFRQGSIGTIRSSLAMSCDLARRRARSPNFDQSEAEKLSQKTDRKTENRQKDRKQNFDMLEGPALRAAPSKTSVSGSRN